MSKINESIMLERELQYLSIRIKALHDARTLEYMEEVKLTQRGLTLFKDSQNKELRAEYFFKRFRIEWLIKIEKESEERTNSLVSDGSISQRAANKYFSIFRDGNRYATPDEKAWLAKEKRFEAGLRGMFSECARWRQEAAQREQTPMLSAFLSGFSSAAKGAVRAICGASRP